MSETHRITATLTMDVETDDKINVCRLTESAIRNRLFGEGFLPADDVVDTWGLNVTAETFIAIANVDDWCEWWNANGGHIDVDEPTAFALARNQSLMVGGGAAPLFRIGFADGEG